MKLERLAAAATILLTGYISLSSLHDWTREKITGFYNPTSEFTFHTPQFKKTKFTNKKDLPRELINPGIINLENLRKIIAGQPSIEMELAGWNPQSDCLGYGGDSTYSCIYWRMGLGFIKYRLNQPKKLDLISCDSKSNSHQQCWKKSYILDESWLIINSTVNEVWSYGKNGIRRASAADKLFDMKPYP